MGTTNGTPNGYSVGGVPGLRPRAFYVSLGGAPYTSFEHLCTDILLIMEFIDRMVLSLATPASFICGEVYCLENDCTDGNYFGCYV